MAMKISDELREFIDEEDLYPRYIAELRRIANRIDSEMAELPRDMDGLPIHAGDTVYLEDGRKADVSCVHIAQHSTSIDFETCGDGRIFFAIEPKHFAHERPDSWERIAYDIETVVPIDDEGDERFRHDIADRIRKLAAKEDKR